MKPHPSLLSGNEHDVAFVFVDEGIRVTRLELFEATLNFAVEHSEILASLRESRRPLAIVAEPTLPALVGLATALSTGVPVLPIHPLESESRRSLFLAESGAPFLLTPNGELRELEGGRATLPKLPEDAAIALATSGTSGRPKWVLHSLRSLLASVRLHRENIPWLDDDRWLLSLPFSHVGGFGVLFRGLVDRKTTVIEKSLRPGEMGYAKHLGDLAITLLSLVPTQLSRLVGRGERAPETLRAVLVGGAPLTPSLRIRALELGFPVVATYGLTEFGSQVATQKPGAKADTVGKPLSENVIRLGKRNRIEISGPSAMLGYWGREDAFSEDGFFSTSDHGVFTEDGELRVLGRLDQLIISGGENVAPELVEAAALELAGVSEALAYGEPDAEWGEKVCLDVVLHGELSETEIMAGLRAKLPAYARPKRIRVVAALPRTTSGKLSRSKIHS